MSSETLASYLGPDLAEKIAKPLVFQWPNVGPDAPPGDIHGHDVTILIDICRAIIAARAAGKLPQRLDAPESKPEKKPLAHRTPATTARALPEGRGFLRVVQGGGSPSPAPAPATPPVAPLVAVASVALVADENGQIDLFSWTPPKREPKQLSLFPT